MRGFQLVGRVFVDERGFQLLLQIAVGREGKAFFVAACRIEADEVARNVLQLALGAFLQLVPCTGTEFVEAWHFAFLAAVFGKFVERVDGYEHLVVVRIGELYHFLHLAVDVRAHQSAELADTVVDVHNVVAHFNLRQFLQRKGEFARTHTVALERIFVETFENLVVGEDARFQVVVDVAFVQGFQHRLERDFVAAVLENHPQAFELRLVVRKYVYFVAILFKVLERLADDVEILVEHALQRGAERKSCIVVATVADRIVDVAERIHCRTEHIGIYHVAHGVHVAFAGNDGTFRYGFRGHCTDTLAQPFLVVENQQGVLADEVEQRLVGSGIAADVVDHANVVDLLFRELCFDIEGTDTFNVVAEEVETVRQFVGKGKNIENGAADGKLPRFVDIVHLLKTEFTQLFLRFRQVGCSAAPEMERTFAYFLFRSHLFGKGFRIGHHPACALVVPTVEHFRA